MAYWQEYVQPKTVEEALRALAETRGEALVVAGGTDLLLDLQQGRHLPIRRLVDVTSIAEMLDIRFEGDTAFLGAAVPHRRIVEDKVLDRRAACLTQACLLIGGPQVRNVATLGGNVAHALPAGDGTIALLALEAEAEIASPGGRRWVPLEELFGGPGVTTFDRGAEVLVRFRFRLAREGEASAFDRVMRPQGVAIAILNMACWLRVDRAGRVEAIRLALGPAGPTPLRARRTEKILLGSVPEPDLLASAARCLIDEATLRSSAHRATREYRQHLADGLLQKTVQLAYRRAVQTGME
ncbi:MAG TPA: FAD binding domain-containing protein [Anaerolineales bacterium]|nr:FAD binding domain-containing protein [Anaerolineales bacterium]